MQAEVNFVERIAQTYVAYRSMRLFCVLAVLISALLLFMLAGGFPPYAWHLLAQALAQFPALLAARGAGALLALVGVLLISVTIPIAWCALLWLSWRMLAYWRYERQELRAFAAEAQEAQAQAEEMDEQYAEDEDSEEAQPVPWPVAGRNYPPATRRRVIYPLSPLPSQMRDTEDTEQAEIEDEKENFFIEEDEEENAIGLYRDEDEDEIEEAEQPVAWASSTPEPEWSGQSLSVDGAPPYDRQIVEHTGRVQASAQVPLESGDNVQHSSYGRILPFSAAPSAGALPHLTTTLYNRVSLSHSVAPRPAQAPAAPAVLPASGIPAPTTFQPAGSSQSAVPAPLTSWQAVPPAPKQSAAPQHGRPVHTGLEPPPAPSASVPRRPTGKLVAPAQPPIQRIALEQPTTQLAAPAQPPVLSPMPAYIANQLAAAQNPLMPRALAAQPVKPAQPPQKHTAMQSLVELITTVPMTPPPLARPPISISKPLTKVDPATRQATTQLLVSTGLDVGLKRRGKPNEDSLLALQNTRVLRGGSCPVGLFVIADGMGGHENGQEASNLVIQSLSKTVVPSIIYGPTDDNYSEMLAEGVHHANLEVYQRNRQTKIDMGTTIVAALVVDTTAYVVSAGDSRVYLYRATSGLTQVTRDHSTVARLVESGLLKPEDVYTHPRRNEIYRSLGHHPSEDLDKFILALQPDDVLLLCSDGLWEMVRDTHIQEIIAATTSQPAQTSAALVQAALDGGGKDNISVIVVYVKAALGAQAAWAG